MQYGMSKLALSPPLPRKRGREQAALVALHVPSSKLIPRLNE